MNPPLPPCGGSEIMGDGLLSRLGTDLPIRLYMNEPGRYLAGNGPIAMWFHQDVNQPVVQWCRNGEIRDKVRWFIFVSKWQRDRYLGAFGIDPLKSIVLENATECPSGPIVKSNPKPICAYASAPYRGLGTLISAWDFLRPYAELHICSSMRLHGDDGKDEEEFLPLYEKAKSLPDVHYRGVVPHDELADFWARCDYLTFPSTFAECGSMTVIEAQAHGVRVVASNLGSIPDQTHGFARLYEFTPDGPTHCFRFGHAMAEELRNPWGGRPGMAFAQQLHFATHYDWSVRKAQWRKFLSGVSNG